MTHDDANSRRFASGNESKDTSHNFTPTSSAADFRSTPIRLKGNNLNDATSTKISPTIPSVLDNPKIVEDHQRLRTNRADNISSKLFEASKTREHLEAKNKGMPKAILPPASSFWGGSSLPVTAASNATSKNASGDIGSSGNSSSGEIPGLNLFGSTVDTSFGGFHKTLDSNKNDKPKLFSFGQVADSSKKPAYTAGPSVSDTSPGTLGSMFFVPKFHSVPNTECQYEQLLFFTKQEDNPLYSPEVRRLRDAKK
jgi:hypothetical protein